MFVKLKSNTFIDVLTLDLVANEKTPIHAVLKNEEGCECSRLETKVPKEGSTVTWKGLNDLPYGKYTLELSQGEDALTLQLVKRI